MEFERRVSEALHHVADADPPADLVDRALAGLPTQRRRDAFAWPLGGPGVAVAAGIAAIVVVALVIALFQRPGPLPPAGEPSPSPLGTPPATPPTTPLGSTPPTPRGPSTPPACPAALIEGTLIEMAPGELGLMEVPIAPGEPSPTVIPITWEPAFFSIVEDNLGRPAVEFESGLLALVGDYVRIGGGTLGPGWYACGSIEVLSSPLPSPSPVIDTGDPAAWRALVAIDRALGGGIEQVRRMEWEGDALHLIVSTSRQQTVDFANAAIRRAGFSGHASSSELGAGFLGLELTDARAVVSPSDPGLGCGRWWQLELRVLGDGVELSDDQLAAAGEVVRRRVADMFGAGNDHEIGVVTVGADLIVRVPIRPNVGFDPGLFDRARPSVLAPTAVAVMVVPAGAAPVAAPESRDDLEPLFGGAGIEDARLVIDQRGRPALEIDLRPDAAGVLDDYAAANVGAQLALVIEDIVVSAPTIHAPRFDGRLSVTLAAALDVAKSVYAAERLRIGVDVLEFEELTAVEIEREC